MIERFSLDVLSAVRALRNAPGTAIGAVVTLAAAVGLNLAMFGLIDRALLSPPAHVVDAERVFTVAFERNVENSPTPARMTTTSYPTFESIRDNVPAAGDAAAWQRIATSMVVDGAQIDGQAMFVSGTYFALLGARPLFGRGIVPDDDRPPAGSPVAVLSYACWMRTFGADRAVLGRRINIRGVEFTVAGVMPARFSGHSALSVDVWVPFHAAMQHMPGWDRDQFRNILGILVRVPRTETAAAFNAQAGAVTGRRVILTAISGAEVAQAEQRIAYWLTGVSVLVFVIGLANTTTLLLVRSARRSRELAIRTALGATRGRLRSQIITEAALLAGMAIAGALVLALWLDDVVRSVLLPSIVPSTGPSFRTLGAAAVAGILAFVCAAAAGFAQLSATHMTRLAGSDPGGPGRSRRQTHTTLLLVQTTVSVVLLAGAGMFGRSLYNLVSQDFGMRMDHVLLAEFDRGPGGGRGQAQLLADALERVRALPGVELAAPVQTMFFTGFHVLPISVPGIAEPPNVNGQLPYLIAATPEFLQILDVTIVRGRRFVDADERGAPVVIVNETMARTVWPGESALGKCIRIGFEPSFDPFTAAGPPPPPTTVPCREVIGVARDVRQRSVLPSGSEARLMQYFVPFSQVPPPPGGVDSGPRILGLLLRAPAGPEVLAAPIRRLVVGDRTDVPFLQVRRYSELLERQMRPWRRGTALLSLFGALALGVAAVGLYAAFAHSVGERRREMAIRLAIGARARGVLTMILREAAAVAGIGAVCGCVVTAIGGRWVQSMLVGTTPSDPLVLGSSALLMLAISVIATFVPARRASRADPSALLRAE